MADGTASSEEAIIVKAIGGDRAALDILLALYAPRLAQHVAYVIPSDLRSLLSSEDVVQEAFVEVCRCIRDCRAGDGKSFFNWLLKVVEHQAADLIRAARAAKRGGDWLAVDASSSTMHWLLVEAASSTRTPSSSAAQHEAVTAVQSQMNGLPEHYREALRLRYFEGLAIGQIASKLGKTEVAVHMLCYRGLRRLASQMGSASHFLSWKS